MSTAQTMLPLDFDPATPTAARPAGPGIRTLRPYQTDTLTKIAAAQARGVMQQLVVLPTGAGKTIVFAKLIADLPATARALVLAHRDELVQQAVAKIRMVAGSGLDIGIVKARQNDAGARIVVGSVQTLSRQGRTEQLGAFDLVIVDEAHHAVAETYVRVLDTLGCLDDGGPLTVGFTATAARTDKLALGQVWKEITAKRGIVQLMAEGYLTDVHGQQIGSDFDMGNLRTRAGDYTDGSIEAELERTDAYRAAVRAWQQYAAGRLTVAFTPTIAAAQQLAAEFSAAGVPAEAVWGTMPMDGPGGRRDVLARLERGELRVVPNCAVLTEGWDCQPVSCALMLRPTKSEPFFIQMVGRILRPFTGKILGPDGRLTRFEKDDALVLDVTGQAEVLGLATLATLAGLKPGQVKGGQSLLDAAEEAEQRERRDVAIGAERTRRVELLRRNKLHWLDVADCWTLTAGADQVMILVPAAADPMADDWQVWRAVKGMTPVRESEATLSLDYARGVGEEVARLYADGILSRSDAAWRKRPASDAQRDRLTRLKLWEDGMKRGAASDKITGYYAALDIKRLRQAAPAAR